MNYKFRAGGPEYSCSYPDSKDVDNNIFLVKGTNDQGKSTLMHWL